MVFENSLKKELQFNISSVFIFIVILMMSTTLSRILADATAGSINAQDVVPVFLLEMLSFLHVHLSISIFVGSLIVLIRWHKDSEMVIWRSNGISLWDVYRTILKVTYPLLIVIFLLSMIAWPWCNEKSTSIREGQERRQDISLLSPGQFKESMKSTEVVFVEKIDPKENVMENIFVNRILNGKQSITHGSSGYMTQKEDGSRELTIINGRKYDGLPGEINFRIIEFDEYTVKLSDQTNSNTNRVTKSTPTWDLLKELTPANQGELLWRLGMPMMAFIFILIAVPLGYSNPRRAQYLPLVMAILIYLFYSNLISLSQVWVQNGKANFYIAAWLVHALIGLAAVITIIARQNYARLHAWMNFYRKSRRNTSEVGSA